jgi:hypothetical protein
MADSSISKIKDVEEKMDGSNFLEILPQTCIQIGEKTVENPHM